MGVPIANPKQRAAITPFASGSLPKHSGEFARLRGRPSGEYFGGDDYDLGTYESMMMQGSSAVKASVSGGVEAED